MNVWSALPRSFASSRCLHAVRSLSGENSSDVLRHYSTNTPASTDSPKDPLHDLAHLVKEALAEADAQILSQHSPPRLQFPSKDLILSPLKRPKRKKKGLKGDKKAGSKNEAASETWPSEPWAATGNLHIRVIEHELIFLSPPVLKSSLPQQDDTGPSVDDLDRSSPPHILDQKIISEGKVMPSVTNTLIDLPPVSEHLPVATLAHGLERVLFK